LENKRPIVVVLMAVYNGISWLPEQVRSIMLQSDVDVKLFISDDGSNDGSQSWLEDLAGTDDRIHILPQKSNTGSAGKNFYRLICDADVGDADFIALADQDDIWFTHKLADQIEQIHQFCADGVSSNVIAFWPDGSRHLINKAFPQKKFDFLYESAGPGCSFLIKSTLFLQIKSFLENTEDMASLPELHDWLIYAVCRAIGNKWHIADSPMLEYRQHSGNVIGAHYGMKARLRRIQSIRRGWYRLEVQKISHIVLGLTRSRELQNVCGQLIQLSLYDRFKLLFTITETRRNRSEQFALALLLISFTF